MLQTCLHVCPVYEQGTYYTFYSLYSVSVAHAEMQFKFDNAFSRMQQELCAAHHIKRSIANRLGLPE